RGRTILHLMHQQKLCYFIFFFTGLLQVSLAANRLRWFLNDTETSWEEARNICLGKGGSLLSLYDEEDADVIQSFTKPTGIWLGLRRNDSYVPTWSNGEKVIFNESTTDLKGEEQLCEAIENETWKSFNCSEEKAFMCQHGKPECNQLNKPGRLALAC
uniref:C-type lectin domain-containing protein n=1 Tax=Cyprinodon variegatus TaxID=28743 RepID=A0A3Q2CJR2_CYPVA